ncbi:MAG: hypothetical protein ABSC19_09270 [Syntrophorhabdales bacterium]
MGLDVDDISKHLKAEFGAYEDSLQDAWVEILERNLQAVNEVEPIARKVRNRAIRQYLTRKYREESLQRPLGHNGDEGFTLESILPAPVSDDSEAMEGDARGNDLYERMVDFLIRKYLKQKQENLELRKKHIELTAERIRLRKESLEFKRCRYESWKRLMEDKGRQKEELLRLHMELQREKLEFREKSLKAKKRTGKARGRT